MKSNVPNKRKILIISIAALVLIGAFGLVMHFIEARGLADEQFGDTGEWGQGGDEVTVSLNFGGPTYESTDDIDAFLLIGTDNGGEDLGLGFNGELADFLSLLIIDNTTETYGFIQIDRNTMTGVEVLDENGESKGTAYEQICIAHWYGLDADQRNANTVNAVSELLGGFPIDGYYTITMDDIGAVNNAIGGVSVRIDEDLTSLDPAFTNGATVLLSDEQAEKYVRARMSVGQGTNKERMSRQSRYIESAYSKIVGQLKENPEYINDLYDQLKNRIESGSSPKELGVLANQLVQYESRGFLEFSGKVTKNDTLGDGKVYEEFRTSEESIIETLQKVINIAIPED